MSRTVNISELADQVLASVRAETSTKTAAAQPTPRVYVPAARELRKLADDLRAAPAEDEVSDADIAALMRDPEVQQLLADIEQNPALLQTILAGDTDEPSGAPMAVPSPVNMPPNIIGAPDLGGEKAATEIRKIAAYLKTRNDHVKQRRIIKAAHILNAAMGLKRLTEGLK